MRASLRVFVQRVCVCVRPSVGGCVRVQQHFEAVCVQSSLCAQCLQQRARGKCTAREPDHLLCLQIFDLATKEYREPDQSDTMIPPGLCVCVGAWVRLKATWGPL